MLFIAFTIVYLLLSPKISLAENPQITVSVYDDAHVPNETLDDAERQAGGTFFQAGLTVNWVNCRHGDEGSSATAFNEKPGLVHLFLRITPTVLNSASDLAFGIAYLGPDGSGDYGSVFWKRVRQLQASSKIDIVAILGAVMAHEIGHLLLGTNSHAVSGIMQARWEAPELQRIRMGTLLFLPEQGQRMRVRAAGSDLIAAR